MQLRLLCVGDVVGSPGRRVLCDALEAIVPQRGIDCVVVNAENAAGGSGITPAIYEKIISCGADVVTLGDHIYRRREIIRSSRPRKKSFDRSICRQPPRARNT